MKNRLIELLGKADEATEILTGDFPTYEEELKAFYSGIADYLLDNGVIVLPCAVGDTLYYISYEKTIQEYKVAYITVTKEEIYVTFKANHKYNPRLHEASGSDFGTKLFLTKEEAEAKLEELKGE